MKRILIALIFFSGIARAQVLQKMELVMGPLPQRDQTALNVKILDSLVEEDHTRYSINFTVAENEVLPALLYIPHKKGKLPGMLVLHGTDALGKMVLSGVSTKPNRAYAKELAQRGYVVIAPDYPTFGDLKDYDFEKDRYASGTMKGIFDHIRCIDLLQARPEVDPNRIGVIGHSLGGHNAIFVAAFDPRIKVIVASSSWTLMDYYNIGEEASKKFGGRLGPWAQTRYMPLIRDKYQLKEVPFDFDELIASLAPRAFFNNSPLHDANFDVKGVEKGMVTITKAYKRLNVEKNLQVRYPDAGHDFPPKERQEAYEFIDKTLHYKGTNKPLLF